MFLPAALLKETERTLQNLLSITTVTLSSQERKITKNNQETDKGSLRCAKHSSEVDSQALAVQSSSLSGSHSLISRAPILAQPLFYSLLLFALGEFMTGSGISL